MPARATCQWPCVARGLHHGSPSTAASRVLIVLLLASARVFATAHDAPPPTGALDDQVDSGGGGGGSSPMDSSSSDDDTIAFSMDTATPDATAVTIMGKLLYRTTRPQPSWMLSMDVDNLYLLPDQPVDVDYGDLIPPGSFISLTCYLQSPGDVACSSISGARVVASAAPVPSVNLRLRLLVMVISLNSTAVCGARQGASVSAVGDAFLDPGGYADYFSSCSYGKMSFDREALRVVSTVIPCTQAVLNCNEGYIASYARRRLPKGVVLSDYTHFMYVMPSGFAPICGWVGLADLPGTQTWFTPDSQGIFEKGTVMQELLHNFGLYHGWKDGLEYMDYSTSMGLGDGCPSAPELWRLGWASPVAQLNTSRFSARTFRTFTLPATYLGPTGVMIKIQPDWLGAGYTKNMYLALRVRAGGDVDLMDNFNKKVNIHELKKDIDNTFFSFGDPMVSLLGTVDPDSSATFFNYKVHILTGGLVNDGSAIVVKLCRFLTAPSECVDPPAPPPAPPRLSPPPSKPPRLPAPPPPRPRSPPPSPKSTPWPRPPPAGSRPQPPTPPPSSKSPPSPRASPPPPKVLTIQKPPPPREPSLPPPRPPPRSPQPKPPPPPPKKPPPVTKSPRPPPPKWPKRPR